VTHFIVSASHAGLDMMVDCHLLSEMFAYIFTVIESSITPSHQFYWGRDVINTDFNKNSYGGMLHLVSTE